MGKTVLITGGSSGIGRAMVGEFARAGYVTWFTYHTGKDRADSLMAELGVGNVRSFHLDLGNRESHMDLMKNLRILAAQLEKRQNDLLEEAIQDLLNKYKKDENRP